MQWIAPSFVFLVFGLSHTLLADLEVKKKLFDRFPGLSPWYRAFYNILSVILLAAWYLLIPKGSQLLYEVPGPWAFILRIIQGLAVFGFIASLMSFHLGTFAGTTQIRWFLKKDKKPEYFDEPERGRLITTGLQAYVRHPLYAFSILFLLASPVMTSRFAYISICIILYFWIGSVFEEKKLVDRFGDQYLQYKSGTGRFLPKWSQLFNRISS